MDFLRPQAHNTNIWAAKSTAKLPLKGVVGVIKLGVDLKENPLGE